MQYDFPSLHQGLVGAWCPSLGAVSRVIPDRSGHSRNGSILTPAYDANLPGSTVAANVMSAAIPSGAIGTSATWSVWLRTFGANGNGCFQVTQASTSELYFLNDGNSYFSTFLTPPSRTIINNSSLRVFIPNQTLLNHIAITTNEGTTTFYANGSQFHVKTGNSFAMRNPILIGGMQRTQDVSATPLLGSWDDARLYNRALTLSEIRLLASRRGIGLVPRPTRPKGSQQLVDTKKLNANDSGTWKQGDAYVNENGIWKPAQTFINDGGTWK